MTNLEEARSADARDSPLEAITAYEAALADGPSAAQVFVDLAAVYLQCADFGYAGAHRLPDNVVRDSYSRARQTLLRASELHSDNPSLQFWLKYIDYVVLGDDIPLPTARALMAAGAEEAGAFLYVVTGGHEAAGAAARVLDRAQGGRSCRERRWRSVLTSRSLPSLRLRALDSSRSPQEPSE